MKSFKELRLTEARQMKDPKKDSMVQKGGKTIVIDKSKEKEYLKKGWSLAESTEVLEEKFVVKYAKNKRGPIYQTKFSTQPEAEKFLAQKKKEGMNGIVSKAGQHTSMQKMKDLQKESVELEEAVDFEKMSNELLKKKKLGIEFEKAAAFARVMFMNSSLSVQDKAMKGLLTLIKGIDDLTVKTTLIKILKDNGFKVKGGRVMREEVELDEALQSVTKIKFDYKDTMPKNAKPSDVGGLKQDWNNDRTAVRSAVKPLGGLVTDSEAPSRTNKFVGTLSIGTRGDASKLSNSAIQKAVKSKGAEIQNNQFMSESVELDEAFQQFLDKSPSNWGEDKVVAYGEKKGHKVIGVVGTGKVDGIVLFGLDAGDKKYVGKEAKVKTGQTVFRYATRNSMAGDLFPLIKIDVKRGLMYHLTQASSSGDVDYAEFESRSVKLKYLRFAATANLRDITGFDPGFGSMKESVESLDENYRTLATHGMGAETKNSINVGRDVDYYEPKNGDKRMGKITKMTRSGYVVKDEKDGKSHTFAFHDRVKAKEILAKSK